MTNQQKYPCEAAILLDVESCKSGVGQVGKRASRIIDDLIKLESQI